MKAGILRMWRYPFHRMPPLFDRVAAEGGTRWQVWGYGLLFHVREQGLFIGWLKRERAAQERGNG